ncbi:MAG: hypothetical protein V7739_16565 [Motiliproteus sp.]
MNTRTQKTAKTEHLYDYSNTGRPRDFDIRIEVAEQLEIVKQSQQLLAANRGHCSEYDF